MRIKIPFSAARVAAFACLVPFMYASAATAPSPSGAPAALDVARFTAEGKLIKPADLDRWVFLGTALGMGYNPARFDPASPGQFQVVLMEPAAYRYFVEHGHYAPGSMFLLSFYDSDQRRSINQTGFVPAELASFEIHLVDSPKAPEAHAFYLFGAKAAEGGAMPKGNECVRCHLGHGAFEGTFAQFYPTIRERIPKDALERAMKDHDIR